jgi:hypothetical protein
VADNIDDSSKNSNFSGNLSGEIEPGEICVLFVMPEAEPKARDWSKRLFASFKSSLGTRLVPFATNSYNGAQIIIEEGLGGVLPDAVLFGPGSTVDIQMLAASGALLDLAPFMGEDGGLGFCPDDYFPAVLDAGFINGGQYIMPFSFSLPLVFTSEERLLEEGLQLEGLNGRRTLEYLSEYINLHANAEKRAVTTDHISSSDIALSLAGLKFIDYEEMVLAFRREQLEYCANLARSLHSQDILRPLEEVASHSSPETRMDALINSADIQISTYYNSPWQVGRLAYRYKKADEDMRLFCVPAAGETDSYEAKMSSYGVALASTENPKAAAEVLFFLAGNPGGLMDDHAISANRKVTEEHIKYLSGFENQDAVSISFSGDISAEYSHILENIAHCTILDDSYAISQASARLKPYIESESTFDECAALLDEDLSDYIEEQLSPLSSGN